MLGHIGRAYFFAIFIHLRLENSVIANIGFEIATSLCSSQ